MLINTKTADKHKTIALTADKHKNYCSSDNLSSACSIIRSSATDAIIQAL